MRYAVTLKGTGGLLLHNDNLAFADLMDRWKTDPQNKKTSVAGDDRTPGFRWLGCLYLDEGRVVIPSDNLMTMLREGGAKCPTGKKQQTFKTLTQSGVLIDQLGWPLLVSGVEILEKDLSPLTAENNFAVHQELVQRLGFELFTKRARIGKAKHIRVRPRFDNWSCSGTLTVTEEAITQAALEQILVTAGNYVGIGDWRPSSPTSPGPFGKFTATVSPLSGARNGN